MEDTGTWPASSRRGGGRTPSLGGARVAVLESRLRRELGRLVERYGGAPVSAPALREVEEVDGAELGAFLDRLAARTFDAAVFFTGVSVTRLAQHAEAAGRRAELVAALAKITCVCRGPKPLAALRAVGVDGAVTVDEPFTTAEILDAITRLTPAPRSFAVVHYGERNATLVETLRARDAAVHELTLYTWRMPEDTAPLEELVARIAGGSVDALAITCQVQVKHLFEIAARSIGAAALTDAINRGLVVAAVGPRCRAVLEAYGVVVHVTPEHPKLGPMIAALARDLEERRAKEASEP